MNRRFHLYPEGPEQQRLRLSASLVDIHQKEGFAEAVEPFGLSIDEVPLDQQMFAESWQEFTVRPPIPREKIAAFGDALVSLANSYGLGGHEEVLFIDHTRGHEELLREAMERKVGEPEGQGSAFRWLSERASSREEFEVMLYGRVLTADEFRQRVEHLRQELETQYDMQPDEIDRMLSGDYALIEEKRVRETGNAA